MDPQACLNAIFGIISGKDVSGDTPAQERIDELRERLQDLTEWRLKGGFLPNLDEAIRYTL